MSRLRAQGAAGVTTLGEALSSPPSIDAASDATATAATSPASAGAAAPPANADDLLSVARRFADADGRLILTFATAVYDPLLRNFVAHLSRLGLPSYLLATFTSHYHQQLLARGEKRVFLHELPMLGASGGSDVFASRDFFLINSARYSVLTRLLRGGLHVCLLYTSPSPRDS